MAERTARRRLETPALPLVEVPDQCTTSSECPNLPMAGDREGRCEEHAVYGATPPPDLNLDFDPDQPFTCA